MTSKKLENKYYDVTKKWLKMATPNSHNLVFDDFFVDDNGIRHPLKGKEFVHPIPRIGDEYDMALWLKKTFGGEIHLVPRITDISNSGLKVSTPDYIWNDYKWDLKVPTLKGKFETTIERFMKKSATKLQAKSFIINFKYFKHQTNLEILLLVKKTLNNPYREWIESLIIVRGEELIKVYSKAK